MTNKNKIDLSGNDYLTYYANNFLSSEQGKNILKQVFKDDHELKKQIDRQLEIHNNIVNKNKEIALNESSPLIPNPNAIVPPTVPHRTQPLPQPTNNPGLPDAGLLRNI